MSIKVTTSGINNKSEYPCLMISSVTGHVYIMTSKCEGTRIKGTDVGMHSLAWFADMLTPYEGSITLTQE